MTTQEFIDAYKALLILQYSSLPNALGTIDAFIASLVQNQIISQFRDAWNIDTAVGVQLDMLATYRGLSRTVFGVTPGNYWSLVEYSDASPGSYFGWAEYNDPDPDWNTEQYNDIVGVSYKLSDSQLRRLIELKAQFDSSPITLRDLDNILYAFFTVYANVVDNEDMTMIYQHQLIDPDVDQLFQIAALAGIFPHPAGVAVSVVEI